MAYAVVRVRGNINVRRPIKDTLLMLRLNRVNHCVIIPESPEFAGMLKKSKDYVTWGEIDETSLTELITARGKLTGDNDVTDKYVKCSKGRHRGECCCNCKNKIELLKHPWNKINKVACSETKEMYD